MALMGHGRVWRNEAMSEPTSTPHVYSFATPSPNDSITPSRNHFPKPFGYHPGMSTVVRPSAMLPPRLRGNPRAARAGFSLVELLVIVAIVVILFSIFVPYAMKMREASRRGQCADNLRAIGFALAQYAGPN